VVVFIEEAQSMPLETLEEVRLLSNLETHRHKLMQIVLFGQPELDRKLEQKSIRQLRERITHSFYLDPLKTEEIREYLHFRLQSAGCPWPQLFSPRAEQMLARASAGLTRRINILADKALLASYADPATRPQPRNGAGEIQPMVLPRHVKVAIADSDYRSYRGSNGLPGWLGYTGAALAGALLVASGYWFWSGPEQATPTAAVAAQTTEPLFTMPATTDTSSARPEPLPVSMARTEDQQQRPVYEREQLVVAVPEPVQEEPTPETDPVQEPSSEAVVIVAEPVPATVAEIDMVLEPEPVLPASTSQRYASLGSLLKTRVDATGSWLELLPGKSGYTVQLYAVPTSNTAMLEEYLEFLLLTELLEETYVCLISGNPARPEQWLVLHGEYAGLSATRRLIDRLPPYIGQHGPYARNLNGIACANERI
jgi:MSHA biogenesis protein MshM